MDPTEFEDGPGWIEPYDGIPCYQPAGLPPEISYTNLLRAYGDARYALHGKLSTLHDDIENENLLIIGPNNNKYYKYLLCTGCIFGDVVVTVCAVFAVYAV